MLTSVAKQLCSSRIWERGTDFTEIKSMCGLLYKVVLLALEILIP